MNLLLYMNNYIYKSSNVYKISSMSHCIGLMELLKGFIFSVFLFIPSFSLLENDRDGLSLLACKSQITDDPLGILSSWNVSVHLCEWSGITCGQRHKRVTVLDISSCKLKGSVSPYIGNLSLLRTLNLQNNTTFLSK